MGALQTIITNQDDLARLAAHLAGVRAIALDTEFLRERTYRAELCLLQIADARGPVCIDPLAARDLAPLAAVLGQAGPLKVMHASRQDIEVLLPATGLPQPVFDTQIAAALAGLPAQIGYGDLVRRMLGVMLGKAHTRADWSARPLTPEQIAYALDDVRYLLPLEEHLTAELARLGRSEWLSEELALLADPGAYSVEPGAAWQRVRGLRGLDAPRARLARELAAWREQRAIDRNKPRGWILDDAILREIVLAAPRSLTALAALAGMPAAVVRHCGAEILERIRAADLPNELAPVNLRARPDPAKAALLRQLSAVHRDVAAELALSPEVLATRRDLERLAAGERELPVLRGWRRAVIGERLLAAL
ncbi:MAG TPA: ribonuclease D [Steroidobacteraceae bacterium]|nr:ribonuclease D [Steroidobacteraceae bacterium]